MRFVEYNAATRTKPADPDPWRLLDEHERDGLSLRDCRRLCFLAHRVQNGEVGEWAGDMPILDLARMVGEPEDGKPDPFLAGIREDPEISGLKTQIEETVRAISPNLKTISVETREWSGGDRIARVQVDGITLLARLASTDTLALTMLRDTLIRRFNIQQVIGGGLA